MCVCVCVCVCAHEKHLSSFTPSKESEDRDGLAQKVHRHEDSWAVPVMRGADSQAHEVLALST